MSDSTPATGASIAVAKTPKSRKRPVAAEKKEAKVTKKAKAASEKKATPKKKGRHTCMHLVHTVCGHSEREEGRSQEEGQREEGRPQEEGQREKGGGRTRRCQWHRGEEKDQEEG